MKPRRTRLSPERVADAFARQHLELWRHAGLAGQYVLLSGARVIDFYRTESAARFARYRLDLRNAVIRRIPRAKPELPNST